MGNQLKF